MKHPSRKIMRFSLLFLLTLLLLAELSTCRKKKNLGQTEKEETCVIYGKTLDVGDSQYMEHICGYCHCRSPQNVICDDTVSRFSQF